MATTKPKANKILDKLKKLKAMSGSSNEHEAQRAMEIMSKLMEKHDISAAMIKKIENQTATATEGEWKKPNTANLKNWEIRLASAIARLFNTKIVVSGSHNNAWRYKRNKILFVGVEGDCEIAIEMYDWVNSMLWTDSHSEAKKMKAEFKEKLKGMEDEDLPDFMKWNTNSFVQSFLAGATGRIDSRCFAICEERKEKYSGNEKALMVLNKKLEIVNDYIDDMGTENINTSLSYSDVAGYSKGEKKGNDVNLNKQFGKTKNDLGQGLLK